MPHENSTRTPRLPWWLAAIAAVGGLVMLNTPKEPSPNKAPADPAKADEAKADPAAEPDREYDPLRLVRDYFRFAPADPPADTTEPAYRLGLPFGLPLLDVRKSKSKPPAPAGLSELFEKHHDPAVGFEFLVATVPDPIDSKFALEFDAAVGGIQRAYEARGFTLHSSLLPWPRTGKPRADDRTRSRPAYRENPGTLLFRRARHTHDDARVLAVVCLVGENPLSGVQKPALTRALRAYKELDNAFCNGHAGWSEHQPGATGIPVLGPFYSGSQSMFAETLRVSADGVYRFTIVSGSASALEPGLLGEDFPGTLRSTVVPNKLITRAVLAYLAGDRSDELPKVVPALRHRVAILRESDTGFGSRVEAARELNMSGGHPKGTFDWARAIDLPFPASVSQLKAEWEKEPHPGPAPNLPRVETVEPRLRAPDRADLDLDGVAPYDRAAAATVAGQTLRSMLTVVERAQVRYVGIVATDSRDVVFLTKLIRERCPHVRVFATEPSVAFTHPDDAYALRGMVVGSTYPLHPAAGWWTSPEPGQKYDYGKPQPHTPSRVLPFPTQASQGYYNAVLALFGPEELLAGYRPLSFDRDRPAAARPPIWVSVVGEGGILIPVHRYNGYDDTEKILYVPPAAHVLPAVSPPNAITPPLGVLLGALGAVAAVGYLAAGLGRRHLWARWAFGRTPAERAAGVPPAPWQWVWRGVLLAAVLLYVVPFTFPVVEVFDPCCKLPDDAAHKWRYWLLLAAGAATLAGVGVVVARLVGAAARPGLGRRDRVGYTALGWAAVGATAAGWLAWAGGLSRAERFFVYVRAADFPAGLSPLVPLLLTAAAAALAARFHLEQADLARRPWLTRPYPRVWRRVRAADQALVEDLRRPGRFARVCGRPFWRAAGGARWVAVGLGVAYLLAAGWSLVAVALPSGEGWVWDAVARGGQWLAAGLVVFTLARFLVLWSRLGTLLGTITRVPMVGAFERVPYEVGRLFSGYLYSLRPHHAQLAATAWALPPAWRKELMDEIARDRPGLAWVFGQQPAAPGIVAAAAGGGVPAPPDRAGLSDERWLIRWLRRRCRAALAALPAWWAKQPIDHAFGVDVPHETGEHKEKGAAAPEPGGGVAARRGRARPAAGSPDGPPPPTEAEQEHFAACYVVMYLGPYFAQLRMLVYALASAAPLLLLAAASYPFQPDRPRLDAVAALLITVVVGTVYVLYRINRDGLVSRVSRTSPDRFTPDTGFLTSVGRYVLPLLLVLAAQLFGLFRFIVEPIFGLFQ